MFSIGIDKYFKKNLGNALRVALVILAGSKKVPNIFFS
jgi:hypothetical protein